MTATYRLQLHEGFGFADAETVVPYLADLGVSHLYLSPVLVAVPGSMHGYDVIDHTRVSPALGGEEGLLALATTARSRGLGLVVDVVPNHMALVAPERSNAPLWQVLREGRTSPRAHWFDVDWDALDGRFGLPLLGDPLEEVLARGEITLDRDEDGEPLLRYFDHVLPLAEGTAPDGDADLADVLARQHYLLASWREKDTVLNYRRFFDVDTLVAVRVEEPDVFTETHQVLLDLNARGIVEGFRIDHPDGLADPEGYLARLRGATLPGTAIWVEKILEGDERLPVSWRCDGTTGYDALAAVTGTLVDPAGANAITDAWLAVGGEPDLAAVEDEAKGYVVDRLLGPERQRLARRAAEALPDLDAGRLAAALDAVLVAGDVYRAYVRPGAPTAPDDLAVLDRARDRAAAAHPDLADEIRALTDLVGAAPADGPGADLAVRLQQTWGPVMAKGIEDTTFYRWHRMIALNEVGGDPALLDEGSADRMHAWASRQQERHPLGMTTLSTHDTKRSEDVRARLLALSGDADSWQRIAEAFADAADEHGVDGPTSALVWQTVAGVGTDITPQRLHDYLLKAAREGKQHTAWVDGDADYEQRLLALADAALAPGRLKALVDTALDHNADAIRALVLGQKLAVLTLPGVPDTYQGCELVDLSLVDPDNRRPVDFADRADRLARLLAGEAPRDLSDDKLLVTSRALRLRRDEREAFGDRSSYEALQQPSRHVVGFVRGGEVAVLLTRAHQRLEAAGGWGEATVLLPEGLWRDELTGTMSGGDENRCADLFATYPVALLRKVHLS
ncbi:MAG: malto-oligosyltrehalose synthase [Nocardioides sp.]